MTHVGKLELLVEQDRRGRFRTEVFERYQRSDKSVVGAMVEMYAQGVSTGKGKVVPSELCGDEVSAATVSRRSQALDTELEKFARWPLEEVYPDLILDARYEKVREDGAIRSRALRIAIGVDWEGRRRVLAVELAARESASSWREFLMRRRQRGLSGVEFVVSNDHPGLRRAVQEVLGEDVWQRRCVHFRRNAAEHLPRKTDDECRTELRRIYDCRTIEKARADLAAWLWKWGGRCPKLCDSRGGQHRGADAGSADLTQRRQLSAADPDAGGGDA